MKKKLPIILFLVLALAAGAYYLLSQKNNPEMAEKAAEKAVVEEMLANCKYDKEICNYFVAQAKAMEKGVVISTTTNLEDYGITTSEMKMNGDDTEINSYKDGELESSMISFEGVTYFKDLKDGSWYSMGNAGEEVGDPKENLMEIQSTYNEENLDMQIKKVGSEACGNLTCDKYEMTDLLGEEESKTYVWIDTKEHLARKMEFAFQGGSNVMEYKYETVQIAKPSPIKEMPAFDAPDGAVNNEIDGQEMNGEMSSQEEIEQMMEEYGFAN